jgi:serine phosphatase RsbU (regulator of sigma subunit)
VLPSRLSRRTLVTSTLVVGLLVAFGFAYDLSYNGSKSLSSDFTYQSAVNAAQRENAILEYQQFETGASPAEIAPNLRLLRRDLTVIDNNAVDPSERAPVITNLVTREDFKRLSEALAELQFVGQRRFEQTVRRNRETRDFSNAMFAFIALLFAVVVGRLRRAIDEGRDMVERLQRAFISSRRALPNVDVGSVLISATRGSNVGGDTYDAFTFDGRYGVFLVADVSGKGIEAAVDTALIKYTIRTLFSEDRDPAQIVSKFASIYARTAENPETFVVLFLAVVDLEDGTVNYASAGHEPAWVVRAGAVDELPPTGAIVGIAREESYTARSISLAPGDALVVSTDGLTESRDGRGSLLGAENVRIWLGDLSGPAQRMADSIVKRLRKRSSSITDDLAILVVKYEPSVPRISATPPVTQPARATRA